ncbi:neprilysin-like [Haemaphysalis longicornis]
MHSSPIRRLSAVIVIILITSSEKKTERGTTISGHHHHHHHSAKAKMRAVEKLFHTTRTEKTSELHGYTEMSQPSHPGLPAASPSWSGAATPLALAPGAQAESAFSSKNSQLRPPPQASSQSDKRSDSALSFFIVTCCAMFVLLVLVLVAVSIFNGLDRKHAQELGSLSSKPCVTSDCQRHTALLIDGLNRTADPCDDFEAYVCSAMRRRHVTRAAQEYDAYDSELQEVVFTWLRGLGDFLEKGPAVLKVADKPLALFESCRSGRHRASPGDREDFRAFLGTLGLCWPDEDCYNVRALGVLLGLVYRRLSLAIIQGQARMHAASHVVRRAPAAESACAKPAAAAAAAKATESVELGPHSVTVGASIWWDLCFWIRLRVLRNSKYGEGWRRLAFYHGPSVLVRRFAARHDRLRTKEEYLAYWTHHRDVLLDATSSKPLRPPTGGYIERVMAVESVIVGALLKTVSQRTLAPLELSFSEIEAYTANVSSAKWLEEVNTNVREPSSMAEFTKNDQILVVDKSVLDFVNSVFGVFAEREIIAHLSWQFIQSYGGLVDASLGDLFDDTELSCARHVEMAYAPLLAVIYSKLRVTENEKTQVDDRVGRLVDKAAQMIELVPWLQSHEKRAAASKLRAVTVQLWPSQQLAQEVDNAYYDFPSRNETSGKSFVATWIRTRKSFVGLAYRRHRELFTDYPPALTTRPAVYDYLTNTVNVAVTSLVSPFYYAHGTTAMFYGAVGFYVVGEVMRSLDVTGLKVDADGRVNPASSWISESSREAMLRKMTCNASQRGDALLPYLGALRVARLVFIDDMLTAEDRFQLSSELNEPRVFLLTLCRLACASSAREATALDCNELLKNSHEFSTIFHCARDSPMNPSAKCTFFA